MHDYLQQKSDTVVAVWTVTFVALGKLKKKFTRTLFANLILFDKYQLKHQ